MVRDFLLLERSEPLAALDAWFLDAVSGQGRIAFIGGEAGVGKSALIDRFAASLRGRARVVRGNCDMLSTPRPLGPLVDIAMQAGGAFEALVLSEPPRDRLFQATLKEITEGLTPTVAIVEDAHWADDGTLDLIRFLARRIAHSRILILITYRDDELRPDHPLRRVLGDLATQPVIARLNLSPLSATSIATLVEHEALGPDIDAELLFRLTGGNPFFATEVLANSATVDGAIPPTARDAVLARASRLQSSARNLLSFVSVIGSPCPLSLLEQTGGITEQDLDDCLSAGMLISADHTSIAFRHDLAEQAIYQALTGPVRARMHLDVLNALRAIPGDGTNPAVLAHHAEAAGDSAAVFAFAQRAAEQAISAGSHREAAAQYWRALRFCDGHASDVHADLAERLAYECYLTGYIDEARSHLNLALTLWDQLGDQLRLGNAYRQLARCEWYAGQNAEARAAVDRALALLEPLAPGPELARAMATRAQLDMLSSETESAIHWGERAIALAESLGETATLIHALNSLGSARLHIEDQQGWGELESSLELALSADLAEDVARAYMNLSWNATHERDLKRADSYLERGIAYCVERDLESSRQYMLSCRSFVRLLSGAWNEALDDAGELIEAERVVAVSRIVALTVRGVVLARRKQPGAEAALVEALSLAESTGEVQRTRPVRTALAEFAWLQGDLSRAEHEAEQVRASTIAHASPWGIGDVLFWLRRATGDDRHAQNVDVGRLAPPYRAALTGDWSAAAQEWLARGLTYDATLALLDGDEWAVRRALTILSELGAEAAIPIALKRLRAIGARKIPRGPRPSTLANPANLTAREAEVLPLLVLGLRNAEIAERLFLSPKTVEHHIGRIFTKLDVRARHEVPAAAGRLGFAPPDFQDRAAD